MQNDDEKVINIEYEVDLYSKLHNILINIEKVEDEHVMMATRGFYNCMAYAGRLSFGPTSEQIYGSLILLKLAEKFMHLTGLNKEPDDTPWVLSSIRNNAMYTLAGIGRYLKSPISEREYKDEIIFRFSEIDQFKIFKFVAKEVKLTFGDKIDILCKEILSERPVIIELKLADKSAHKQLRSYAVSFKNPILINISEVKPTKIRNDILYYTYNELLPRSKYPFETLCETLIPTSSQQN